MVAEFNVDNLAMMAMAVGGLLILRGLYVATMRGIGRIAKEFCLVRCSWPWWRGQSRMLTGSACSGDG